jgi:DNA-binding transcriptional ArsR family regulator
MPSACPGGYDGNPGVVEALAALADPTRRELVALLADGEPAAGELAG